MKKILITGGSGFFGGILKRRLLAEGHAVHNIDLVADPDLHAHLVSTQGDIRDKSLLARLYQEGHFDAVFHCAAQLAHDTIDSTMLWTSNVDGTRNIAEACRDHGVPKLVNISTNCLWASNLGREVVESEPPAPVELYGKSKLAAEELLKDYESTALQIVTIRCPTIIDSGRLGLLAILFRVHPGQPQGLGRRRRREPLPVHLRTGPRHRLPPDARLSGTPTSSTSAAKTSAPSARSINPSSTPPAPVPASPACPKRPPSPP